MPGLQILGRGANDLIGVAAGRLKNGFKILCLDLGHVRQCENQTDAAVAADLDERSDGTSETFGGLPRDHCLGAGIYGHAMTAP